MAPELLRGDKYNLKADVYSFAIILWQMLAAYAFVRSKHQLVSHVVDEQGRPDIDEDWPVGIKNMLVCGFDDQMELRPVSINEECVFSTLHLPCNSQLFPFPFC